MCPWGLTERLESIAADDPSRAPKSPPLVLNLQKGGKREVGEDQKEIKRILLLLATY